MKTYRTALIELIEKHTGVKNQSENLKQALRYARGSIKSTLSTEREYKNHIETINRYIANNI